MMYKKLILTLPLWGNYGGMLQAYALWLFVSRLQASVAVVEHVRREGRGSLRSILSKFRFCLKLEIKPRKEECVLPLSLYQACADRFHRVFQRFNYPGNLFYRIRKYRNTTWIVGSDQVWRCRYAKWMRYVAFFFLDFLPEEVRRRSIAYAASFGTDEWEGTPEETAVCRELLQQFKAVSVREHSGVKICREVFGVEAVQMPDPTLLLEVEDYAQLIKSERTHCWEQPYIAAYVLDETPERMAALQAVSDAKGLPVQQLMPHVTAKQRRDRFPLSVQQWLRYIQEAECLVTDSFHGCVFAIIFNKPFVCMGNEGRGSARFDTLFQTFHLESRLALTAEQALRILEEPIDWESVNSIRKNEQARGLDFLNVNLS